MKVWYKLIKRLADIVLSLIGIIITSPIMIATMIAIKLESKGPAIFKQERIGKNGKPFVIYKFRSMVVNKEQDSGFSVASDTRITKTGKFIRRYKIDELPQFFNVLKGDMSFVGPRPYVYNDFKYNKEEELKVLDGVRPGITGLASFIYKRENYILERAEDPKEYYRNVLLKEKSKLNLLYKDNISIILDIKIVLATVKLLNGIKINNVIYYPESGENVANKNKDITEKKEKKTEEKSKKKSKSKNKKK